MFQKELGLAIVPFVDGGFNIDSKRMELNNDTWVWTSGLEMRWRSPMGDLRVAYGWPLSDNYDGKRRQGRFEFTMGSFF
jgi:outer membrane protein insertion porin family